LSLLVQIPAGTSKMSPRYLSRRVFVVFAIVVLRSRGAFPRVE
jgi:hypothetical protein